MEFPIIDLLSPEASEEWLLEYFHPAGLKCPKCKSAFTIPELPGESSQHARKDDGSLDSETELETFAKSSASGDDFDVDEFLMTC